MVFFFQKVCCFLSYCYVQQMNERKKRDGPL